MLTVWEERLDELPDLNDNGASPISVLRDAARKEAPKALSHNEVCDLVVAVSETTSNGILHGSNVTGTIKHDHKKLVIEVANSRFPSNRDFDSSRGEDEPDDDLLCHHRGLQIAKALLEPIGGALRLIKNGKTIVAIIEVATKQTKP